MNNYFSIGETAKLVNTTTETLRHYDRIGLVKPSKKDEWTKYRYYTKQDIVRLSTVRALHQMDVPLQEIKKVMEYDDLKKIVDYLTQAERKADAKIAALEHSKSKILLAKADYEKKISEQSGNEDIFIKDFPQRTIMLSSLEAPTIDNLWNYHRHFYNNIESTLKKQFEFEDVAGIYTEDGSSQMFAVCSRYVEINGLKILSPGKYLCVNCDEENKKIKLAELMKLAKENYGVEPKFSLEMIVISGVLKWKYQLQVLVSPSL